MKAFISHSEEDTRDHAASFAAGCRPGTVVRLSGDLGAGKTVWVAGLAAALGANSDVSSPTFALVNVYPCRDVTLYHWDLYRLDAATDWSLLEFEDHMHGDGITVVEWPQRYPFPWPGGSHDVHISHDEENRRVIDVTPTG